MNYTKLTTSFVLLFIVCFSGQAQTGNYQLKNETQPSATAASPGTSSASTTTVYIANSTSNTYYLSFYNTATAQYYYQTLNPWTTPTPVLPVGNYNITVTNDGNAYPTWMYFISYMTYGTTGYFANVSLTGPYVTVGFGD